MTVGVILIGIGISFTILSNFGTDPCSSMNLGISQKIGLTFGVWQCILNVILLVFMLFLDRSLAGPGTVVSLIFVGLIADWFRWGFAAVFPYSLPQAARIALLAAGIALVGAGAALYMNSGLGVSPYDSLAIIAARRTRLDFKWCRILCDGTAALIGWLTGGAVGVGTLIIALCLGPFIRFFSDRFSRLMLLPHCGSGRNAA